MPKKSASAHGGAQRNKPKVQKNIELVRPTTASDEPTIETVATTADAEPTTVATNVDTMIAPKTKGSGATRTRTRSTTTPKVRESSALVATPEVKKEEKDVEEQEEAAPVVSAPTAPDALAAPAPKSAAARLAARRQAGQKSSPRLAVTLITAEHYSYVRRDLVFIAVLALIMFAAIIILHFVPGIGS